MLTFIETKLFTRLVQNYLRLQQGQVWMLTLYAKNEADTIPDAVLKKIKEELDGKD